MVTEVKASKLTFRRWRDPFPNFGYGHYMHRELQHGLGKQIDPYREALETYQRITANLDYGIERAMRALFDYGDLGRLKDRKVFVVYGIRVHRDGSFGELVYI